MVRFRIPSNLLLSKNFWLTGFEAGGQNTPSNIWPWSIVGDQSSVYVATDRSSCFERNKIALRMDVLCDSKGCPSGGVGVYNPGYWGMVSLSIVIKSMSLSCSLHFFFSFSLEY